MKNIKKQAVLTAKNLLIHNKQTNALNNSKS